MNVIFDYSNLKAMRVCLEFNLLTVGQLDELALFFIENYSDFDLYNFVGNPKADQESYSRELKNFISRHVNIPLEPQKWRRFLVAFLLDSSVNSLSDFREFYAFLKNKVDDEFSDQEGFYKYYDISALCYVDTLYDDWLNESKDEKEYVILKKEFETQKKAYIEKYLNIL